MQTPTAPRLHRSSCGEYAGLMPKQRVWSGGLPIWLGVGLALVGGLALAALFWDKEPWAIAATAGATVLLAIFTAQLYSAAFAQLRASSRPLLVEVKPYAPLLPDLAHQMKPDKRNPEKKRPCYQIDFPDGVSKPDWDARRPYAEAVKDKPLRVSIAVRNVGTGLALIDESSLDLEHSGHPIVRKRHVRYPRLPPGESTRLNLVAGTLESRYRGLIKVVVRYTDLSGVQRESAHITLEYSKTQGWARDDQDCAWILTDLRHDSKGLAPLQ
jgi:hypothetical protein